MSEKNSTDQPKANDHQLQTGETQATEGKKCGATMITPGADPLVSFLKGETGKKKKKKKQTDVILTLSPSGQDPCSKGTALRVPTARPRWKHKLREIPRDYCPSSGGGEQA